MNHTIRAIASLLLLSYLTGIAKSSLAQPITPAADGTGTMVNSDGPQFKIEGGQLSKDGANLFHSFEQFGLDPGQVANFLSNPDIQNILGRITGGDASIINGLIQLTGGNSNLYLMNPAGILFGPNAQLNVPADFFATTATGIGFSQGNWLNAVGDNHWANLIGTPSQFSFSTLQPGAIVNQGNLTLEPGQNLTLLGGTLLNTGTLSAPGGNITLSAVPGESIVRISQENHLLSLDIRTGISGLEVPTPQSLPELLTGSGATHANQVTVNPDGSIQLSSSGINIQTQTGDNIASGNIAATEGQIALLGNRVAVIDADINASGTNGGGTILIGGDYQGNGSIPNAVQTFISPHTTIHADAIETGDGGRVIIWADETTQFFGNISAQGGPEFGDGGFVEVSGLEFLEYQGQVDTLAPNGNLGTLLLDPTNIEIVVAGTGNTTDLSDVDAFAQPNSGLGGTKLDVMAINAATANVILQATNDITFSAAINNPNLGIGLTDEAGNNIRVNADITLNQGNIDLLARGGISITNARINTGGGNFTATGTGNATLRNGISLDTGVINAGGGNINLTGRGLDGITTNQNRGIRLNNSRIETTGNGIIALEGTGGTGIDENAGILVNNSTIVSGNGDITLTGTGGDGTGELNRGINLQSGSRVESTGAAVAITGIGGSGTDENYGIFVGNTTVSGNGDITLNGIGGEGTGQLNRGVGVENGSIVESTGGAVAITGIGGSGTDGNMGIFVDTNTTVFGNGDIILIGIGGEGTGQLNRGVNLLGGSVVESTGGAIAIMGIGGSGTDENTGIFISTNTETSTTVKTGNGDITLNGIGGEGTGQNNSGIVLSTLSTLQSDNPTRFSNIESTGSGEITLEGTGGNGAEGIRLQGRFLDWIETDNGDTVNPLTEVTVTTASGNLTFDGTIDGSSNFILNAGTGNINLNGAIGSQTPLGKLEIISANDVTMDAITAASLNQVAGTGTTTFNGPLSTRDIPGINVTTHRMVFDAPVTTTGNGPVTLTNSSLVEMNSPFNLEGSFQQIGLGQVTISNDLNTNNNDIRFTGPVMLNGGVSLTPGTSRISFASSLNTGNNPLTLTAGEIDFNGPVTGTNTLTLQPATPTQNRRLGGAMDSGESLDLTANDLAQIQGEFTAITVGRADSSGEMAIVNPVLFNNPITLEAGSGLISVQGQITGENQASVSLNASTIQLNSDIITNQNDIALTGKVILGNDITLDTNSEGGNITVVGNIDSHSVNQTLANLILNAGTGAITLRGNLGNGTPLQSVTVTSNRGTLHGNAIAAGGDITFNGAIALAEALQISTAEGGGNITFAGTLDSQTNLGQNLTLSAGMGTITFNRALGSLQPLGNVTILNAGNIAALDTIAAASFRALSTGTITLQGNLTTTEAPGVQIQSANQLRVADMTTNGQALSLESQTASVTTGNLDTSSVTTGGAITLTSTQGEITTGNLTASGVNQGGDITMIAEIAITAGEIDSSATIGDAGNVFLDPIGDIQVSWINAQGGTDGSGGEVFIETTGGFFRAMRSFASDYSPTGFASISTAGGNGGGSITLKHEGGDLGDPIAGFEIGNPTLNGTADVILTGTSILNFGEVFPRSVTRGNITMITDDATSEPVTTRTPTISPNPIVPETLPEEPASTPTPGSEATPPEIVPQEPISTQAELPVTPIATTEAVVIPEIPQEPAVNDSLPQPEPVQMPSSPPATAMTPEPMLTVSPAPSLPVLSPPTEPEPVVSATLPPEITPDFSPTAGVGEGLPISPIETVPIATIENSLSRVELSEPSHDWTEVAIAPLKLDTQIMTREEAFSREFMAYLDYPDHTLELLSVEQIQEVLRETEEITEVKTAVIYMMFGRKEFKENSALLCPTGDDRTGEQEFRSPCDPHPEDTVELFVVTGVEEPLHFQIPAADREWVEQLAQDLRTQVRDVNQQFTNNYLATAQALHQLVIEPIEPALKERGIQNLVLIPDAGLRSIPFAALHNGKNFLIEDYSMALVPSFSLTQPRYTNLQHERVLAMGSSKFESLPPSPTVAVELNTIICPNQLNRNNCWPGEVFLNEAFTFNTLNQRGNSGDFRSIHLATHADFRPGDPENSYIQLWDKRVEFSQIKELQWIDPEVELLVLSSWRTAVGDEQAELGFAGLALQSGVKSAIASLWDVNDEATLGLMSELYQQLRSAPIRAEGLRRAQLQLLRGEVRFEGGQLVGSDGAIALPQELEHLNGMDLSHPYYWSGFITIGSPW